MNHRATDPRPSPLLAMRCRLSALGIKLSPTARQLWLIVLVKLAVMFLVLRLFFFPDVLEERYDTDQERAQAVRTALMGSPEGETQEP